MKPELAEPAPEPLSEVSEDDEHIVAEQVKALERCWRVDDLPHSPRVSTQERTGQAGFEHLHAAGSCP